MISPDGSMVTADPPELEDELLRVMDYYGLSEQEQNAILSGDFYGNDYEQGGYEGYVEDDDYDQIPSGGGYYSGLTQD